MLGISLIFSRSFAASGDYPMMQDECVSQGGTYQVSDVKQLLCYFLNLPECDSLECATCICLINYGVVPITSCPVSLPSPGMRVRLSLALDKRSIIEPWQIPVGFGERRPLNFLIRAKTPTIAIQWRSIWLPVYRSFCSNAPMTERKHNLSRIWMATVQDRCSYRDKARKHDLSIR